MTRSMTAYSCIDSEEIDGLKWKVEIHSVNRKALDINLFLPRELLSLDIELRKMIAQVLQRGQVTVKVTFEKGEEETPSLSLLGKLKTEWETIATEIGFSKNEITLPFLLEQMKQCSADTFSLEAQAELKKTLKEALTVLIKMKEIEGEALAYDLIKRVKTLKENLQAIETLSAKAPDEYREKLIERLKNILSEVAEDERVLREVALFAERADVSEEITRLKSHFKQMESLTQSKEESIGRTLDFLIQEILRELNTIASKSSELTITQLAIASKAELEKIREQVQNIE